MRTTCQRIGWAPISTSAFGIAWVCSWRRVPRPPHRIATGPTPSIAGGYGIAKPTTPPGLFPACDRGQDRHLVAFLELGVEAVLEADVLPRDVDVDEAAKASVLGDPLAEVVVLVEDGVQRLADRGALDLDLALAVGHASKLRRDLHRDCHRGAEP